MSKKRTIVTIEPMDRICKEAFYTPPMECPYCKGRGYFMRDTPSGPEREECPDCKGTGEVYGFVVIDWRANVRKDDEAAGN